MFFDKSKQSRREMHYDMWADAHYKRLFSSTPVARTSRGHQFEALFTIRRTIVPLGSRTTDHLFSKIELEIGHSEYCQYVVCLDFSEDLKSEYGYMSFGWQTLDRTYPSIDLQVPDLESLSDTLIRLYVDNKSVGGAGLRCTWSADVTSILGKSATEVWGDWLRDDWRTNATDPYFLPGRRAFELTSLIFQCD